VQAKRETAPHFIDELDGRLLVTRIVDLQDADPGAVVDRRELVEPFGRPGDPFEKRPNA
jgi:hypothetical protein